MLVKNFSVYTNKPYSPNFPKLYKGVIVVVDNYDGKIEDSRYVHFSIRNKKSTQTIFKTKSEKMNSVIFNDADCSITCDFENNPKNKSEKCLVLDNDVYNELKFTLPSYMKENGCLFTETYTDKKYILVFTGNENC